PRNRRKSPQNPGFRRATHPGDSTRLPPAYTRPHNNVFPSAPDTQSPAPDSAPAYRATHAPTQSAPQAAPAHPDRRGHQNRSAPNNHTRRTAMDTAKTPTIMQRQQRVRNDAGEPRQISCSSPEPNL